MAEGAYITRFREASYNFYRWRYESNFLVKSGLAFLFAGLTGLGALMKFYTPWTPVPITGQVFFVLAAGVVLGRHYGGLSQVIYSLIGIAGVPWFAGSNRDPTPLISGLPGLYQGVGGVAILFGATFGYILGFILAAFLVGGVVDSRLSFRRHTHLAPLLLAAIGLIYMLGAAWFYIWWNTWSGYLTQFGALTPTSLLVMTVIPFVPLDLVKAAIVVAIGGAVLPKRAYGAERGS